MLNCSFLIRILFATYLSYTIVVFVYDNVDFNYIFLFIICQVGDVSLDTKKDDTPTPPKSDETPEFMKEALKVSDIQ